MSYRPSSSALTATPAEIARRNGITTPGPPQGSPVIREGRTEPPTTLKGAVKVAGFPPRTPYPFAEIAANGGVWRLDPAAFLWRGKPTRVHSIRAAASKYAIDHGMKAKTVIDGGFLYIQFTGGAR